jgi:hypothetical protein
VPEPRFHLHAAAEGPHVLDTDTGLVWEAAPSEHPVPWDAAVRDDAGLGWRLPTISELMRLLSSLPADHPFPAPGSGSLFWSSTESPFATRSRVRAVGCQSGPLFVVRLIDKQAQARAWRVRDGKQRN